MSDTPSLKPAARAMRARADTYRGKGWVRNNFWLSPESVDVLDQIRDQLGFTNREMTVNAIIERIGQDMFLRQEFLSAAT